MGIEPSTPLNGGRGFAKAFDNIGWKWFQQRYRVAPYSVSPCDMSIPTLEVSSSSSEFQEPRVVNSFLVTGAAPVTSNRKVFEERFDAALPGAVTYNTFSAVSNLVELARVALVRPTLDDCELFCSCRKIWVHLRQNSKRVPTSVFPTNRIPTCFKLLDGPFRTDWVDH